MKINSTSISINSLSHLTDSQYLLYFLKLHNIDIESYHEYCQNIYNNVNDETETTISTLLKEYSVNILPYLFTCHVCETKTFARFLIYCSRYIELPLRQCNVNHNDMQMLYILSSNLDTMVIVLLLMQYYFL